MTQLATPQGNYFEDFAIGQVFQHGVPRTVTQADATLYQALTGSRFALHCADTVAQQSGFSSSPLDNLLVFHIAFGKTVNDISLNAVANLGYAELKFERACFAGDTIQVTSEVIGLKQNSSGKNGNVYVRSTATNQFAEKVVSWVRWVMVANKQAVTEINDAVIPELQSSVAPQSIELPKEINLDIWQDAFSDNQIRFQNIQVGEQIFHRDGMTINDSDHSLATRLYQNNARVHFDQHMMESRQPPRRLVYGGHIISLCRALSYNGLGNALWLCAINSGSHANPCYAGDTIYCQSEIIDKYAIPTRSDLGLVRIRMLGIKNNHPDKMSSLYQQQDGRTRYHQDLVLDLDYWLAMVN